MSKNFLNSLSSVNNEKTTENGQFAYKSTNSSLIDLFGTIGALRSRSEQDINSAFEKAFCEDNLLALKMLFYARDILEGLGERRTFRTIATYMASAHTEAMRKNLKIIPDFGRWDDLYIFVGTPLERDAFTIMKEQYEKDLSEMALNHPVSLLAKWLKSVNTSSAESKTLGRLTAKYFGLSEKDYRKSVASLRNYIDIVETKMSQNNWSSIDYEKVPSKASNNYSDAFKRHDEERYTEFLNAVESGEKKINAKAIMPYDIIKTYLDKMFSYGYWGKTLEPDKLTEEQWKALPDFVNGDKDFLIMADVSGSMRGLPMEVSVSLAIYFAERNKGLYHGNFMTFSSKPELITLRDDWNLYSKCNETIHADWGGSTNLEAAFSMILEAAKRGNVSNDDLPKALVVITDMEIDYACAGISFTKLMKQKYKDAGYDMPVIVWWNVDARADTFHSNYKDDSVRFISGCSAATFKGLCEHMGSTPYELMVETLNDPRYDSVRI